MEDKIITFGLGVLTAIVILGLVKLFGIDKVKPEHYEGWR